MVGMGYDPRRSTCPVVEWDMWTITIYNTDIWTAFPPTDTSMGWNNNQPDDEPCKDDSEPPILAPHNPASSDPLPEDERGDQRASRVQYAKPPPADRSLVSR